MLAGWLRLPSWGLGSWGMQAPGYGRTCPRRSRPPDGAGEHGRPCMDQASPTLTPGRGRGLSDYTALLGSERCEGGAAACAGGRCSGLGESGLWAAEALCSGHPAGRVSSSCPTRRAPGPETPQVPGRQEDGADSGRLLGPERPPPFPTGPAQDCRARHRGRAEPAELFPHGVEDASRKLEGSVNGQGRSRDSVILPRPAPQPGDEEGAPGRGRRQLDLAV